MSKNITIISTSPRVHGNSDILADEFMRGAVDAGHEVEKVSLAEQPPEFCIGCLSCQETGHCRIDDGIDKILEKMLTSDVIVFATPVYFYEMCGQMKTFLDRTNPLFVADYAFRSLYLLAAAAEEADTAVEGTIKGLRGWLDCFHKAHLAGIIFAGGVTGIGEIKGRSALNKAYEMGKSL